MAFSSEDMPDRDLVADLEAADRFLAGDLTMIDVAAALQQHGFDDVAANVLEMGRQRVAADYLQPSAIFDRDFRVLSAINDVNDYAGPGTGYRLNGRTLARNPGHPPGQIAARLHRRQHRRPVPSSSLLWARHSPGHVRR